MQKRYCYHCNFDREFIDAKLDGVNNVICKHCLKKHWELCNISKHGYHYKHSGCPNTHTIHNPHWYPDDLFFYKEETENTKQYFGFELEYEFFENTSAYDDISNSIVSTDKDKHYWLSQDHSLDCGWELKNHPMTYNYIVNSQEIKDLFEKISKATYDENCGLHFHISRDSFTEDGIKNLDYIVYNCGHLMTTIGGRKFNDFCIISKKDLNAWGISSNNSCEEHYRSVNLYNKNTIEIRFCVSTNNYQTFIKRLTFIKALCDFCNQFKFEDFINIDMSKDFIDYIKTIGFKENEFGGFDFVK